MGEEKKIKYLCPLIPTFSRWIRSLFLNLMALDKAPYLEKLTHFFNTQQAVSVAIVFGLVAKEVARADSDIAMHL